MKLYFSDYKGKLRYGTFDLNNGMSLGKVIKELADKETTMVIVTHEMAFARDVAHQVIFMDDGYIVEQGNPKEVFENPKEERTIQFLSRFNQE